MAAARQGLIGIAALLEPLAAVRGDHHHHRCVGQQHALADAAGRLPAVHAGHLPVHEDDVVVFACGTAVGQACQGLAGIGCQHRRVVARMDEFNSLRRRWEPILNTYPLLILLDAKGDRIEEMKQAKDRLEAAGLDPTLPIWFEERLSTLAVGVQRMTAMKSVAMRGLPS